MTQHKVIAEDSLSAMDEISKVLGKDAVILKTKKVNGKIEILGSNNIEDIASSNAKKITKGKRIFEFTDTRFHKEGVNTNNKLVYKPMYPGFQGREKHPKQFCVPCCFTRCSRLCPHFDSKRFASTSKGIQKQDVTKCEVSRFYLNLGPYFGTKMSGAKIIPSQ